MSRLRPLVLAAVALVALSAPRAADAQIIPRSAEVDVFGGYYFFTNNLENFKHGPALGGRLGINFLEFIGAEATVVYIPTTTDHGGKVSHYVLPHFDLIIHLTPWNVVPYLAVGAGFRYYQIEDKTRAGVAVASESKLRDPYLSDEQLNSGSLIYRDHDMDFVFDVGGGIKFLFFERGGLRIDARYVLSIGPAPDCYDPNDGVDTQEWRNSVPACDAVPAWVPESDLVYYNDIFHHIELTGAIFFLLGGGSAKDTDGDGIPDRDDECPEQAEDFDNFRDEDGCPDRDNDEDGVPDVDDQCIDEPEDRDGWMDGDGCPDPDNDRDGIPDISDACPDQAEDIDGFQDADGCPDPDNDGDGIPDVRDGCPMEAEDKDGFRDDDGCPEPDNDGDGIPDAEDLCPNAAEEINGIDDDDGCPEQDSDGDGVYDARDQCPGAQEDLDGFEDSDGCPDLDNDGDGIEDQVDQCPNDPEDVDGWEDGDGCPDFDNDEDGIPDDRDTCPNRAEDEDGFEDMDGCPDLDNDQDGILDVDDRCPNHPESMNGFEDEDGCPDEIPEALKKFTGVIPDINFKADSEELLSSSFTILDQAARVLLEYPDVRMEIQGHASSEGEDDYNLDLSQRRAGSVRRYLIGRGVEAWRLSAVGYGELRPIATNKTEPGRAQNRRVEFQIVQAE
jgi:outer membrane protein OmpA-like peptidoglycan-associated protein